jgi:hypothetical protein
MVLKLNNIFKYNIFSTFANPQQNSSTSLPLAPLFIPKNNFLFLGIFFPLDFKTVNKTSQF